MFASFFKKHSSSAQQLSPFMTQIKQMDDDAELTRELTVQLIDEMNKHFSYTARSYAVPVSQERQYVLFNTKKIMEKINDDSSGENYPLSVTKSNRDSITHEELAFMKNEIAKTFRIRLRLLAHREGEWKKIEFLEEVFILLGHAKKDSNDLRRVVAPALNLSTLRFEDEIQYSHKTGKLEKVCANHQKMLAYLVQSPLVEPSDLNLALHAMETFDFFSGIKKDAYCSALFLVFAYQLKRSEDKKDDAVKIIFTELSSLILSFLLVLVKPQETFGLDDKWMRINFMASKEYAAICDREKNRDEMMRLSRGLKR